MYIPIPIVIGAVALILLFLLLLVGGRRSSRRDLLVPPASFNLSPDIESEARDLLLRGRKLEAIKLVRERSGIGLKESKDLVERMEVRP